MRKTYTGNCNHRWPFLDVDAICDVHAITDPLSPQNIFYNQSVLTCLEKKYMEWWQSLFALCKYAYSKSVQFTGITFLICLQTVKPWSMKLRPYVVNGVRWTSNTQNMIICKLINKKYWCCCSLEWCWYSGWKLPGWLTWSAYWRGR